jgi:hypothetical protein
MEYHYFVPAVADQLERFRGGEKRGDKENNVGSVSIQGSVQAFQGQLGALFRGKCGLDYRQLVLIPADAGVGVSL